MSASRICSMISSDLIGNALSYLGFLGLEADGDLRQEVAEALSVLIKMQRFRYLTKRFDRRLPFLEKEPYRTFLGDAPAYYLSLMTLGGEVELYLRRLALTDLRRALVADACGSALLEQLADGEEARCAEPLSRRFCPGYEGSPVEDVAEIHRILDGGKIGVALTDGGLMIPQKSMAAVLAVGGARGQRCNTCPLFAHCVFRKEQSVCKRSESI